MDPNAGTAANTEAARKVSCAILIGTCGRLLLQQRDDVPHIVHPGLIGLFGGHRDPGESALGCLLRELEEEIGVRLPPDRAEPFLSLYVTMDDAAKALDLAIYIVRDVPLEHLVVTEGTPLITELAGLPLLYSRMTPSTAFVLRQFLLSSRPPGATDAQRQAMSAQQQ